MAKKCRKCKQEMYRTEDVWVHEYSGKEECETCEHPERKRIAYGEFCEVCKIRVSTEPPPTKEQTEAYLKKLFGVK